MNLIADYDQVELYLDNDANGKRTTQKLIAYCDTMIDKATRYKDYKDVNQWHIKNTKNGLWE